MGNKDNTAIIVESLRTGKKPNGEDLSPGSIQRLQEILDQRNGSMNQGLTTEPINAEERAGAAAHPSPTQADVERQRQAVPLPGNQAAQDQAGQQGAVMAPPPSPGTYNSPAPVAPPAGQAPMSGYFPPSPESQSGFDFPTAAAVQEAAPAAQGPKFPVTKKEKTAARKAKHDSAIAAALAGDKDSSITTSASQVPALSEPPGLEVKNSTHPLAIIYERPLEQLVAIWKGRLAGLEPGSAEYKQTERWLEGAARDGESSEYVKRARDREYQIAYRAAYAAHQPIARYKYLKNKDGIRTNNALLNAGDGGTFGLLSTGIAALGNSENLRTGYEAVYGADLNYDDSPVNKAMREAGFHDYTAQGQMDRGMDSGAWYEKYGPRMIGFALGAPGKLYGAVGKAAVKAAGKAATPLGRRAVQVGLNTAGDFGVDVGSSLGQQYFRAIESGHKFDLADSINRGVDLATTEIPLGLLGNTAGAVGDLQRRKARTDVDERAMDVAAAPGGTTHRMDRGDTKFGWGPSRLESATPGGTKGLLKESEDIAIDASKDGSAGGSSGTGSVHDIATDLVTRETAPKVRKAYADEEEFVTRRWQKFLRDDPKAAQETVVMSGPFNEAVKILDKAQGNITDVEKEAARVLKKVAKVRVIPRAEYRSMVAKGEGTVAPYLVGDYGGEGSLRSVELGIGDRVSRAVARRRAQSGDVVATPIMEIDDAAVRRVAPPEQLDALAMQPGFGGGRFAQRQPLNDPKTGGVGKRGKDNVAKRGDANDPELMTTARKGDAMRGYGVPHGPHQMGEGVNRAEAPHVPSQRELDEGLDSANAAGSRIDPAGLGRDPMQYDIDRTGLGDAPTYVKHGDEAAKPAERGIGDMIASEVDRPAAAPVVDDMLGAPGMQPGFGAGRFAPRQPLHDPKSPTMPPADGDTFRDITPGARAADDNVREAQARVLEEATGGTPKLTAAEEAEDLVIVMEAPKVTAEQHFDAMQDIGQERRFGSGGQGGSDPLIALDQAWRDAASDFGPRYTALLDEIYKRRSDSDVVTEALGLSRREIREGAHKSVHNTDRDVLYNRVNSFISSAKPGKPRDRAFRQLLNDKRNDRMMDAANGVRSWYNMLPSSGGGNSVHMVTDPIGGRVRTYTNGVGFLKSVLYAPHGPAVRAFRNGTLPKNLRILFDPDVRELIEESPESVIQGMMDAQAEKKAQYEKERKSGKGRVMSATEVFMDTIGFE